MRLVYKATQQPANAGDTVDLDGEPRTIALAPKPHKTDSEGYVFLAASGPDDMISHQKLNVSVVGLEWIDREDRFQLATAADSTRTLDFAPFTGDGRSSFHPMRVRHQTRNPQQPKSITGSQARALIERLVENGHSIHSTLGGTLWVAVAWCERQERRFVVVEQFVRDQPAGFYLKLMDVEEPREYPPEDDAHKPA